MSTPAEKVRAALSPRRSFRCWGAIDDALHRFAAGWLAQPVIADTWPAVEIEGVRTQVLHRATPFQVEAGELAPHVDVPPHIHPRMDSIEVGVAGGVRLFVGGRDPFARLLDAQLPAFTRGRGIRINADDWHHGHALEGGTLFLSIQHWRKRPSSALHNYIGPRFGPRHDALR